MTLHDLYSKADQWAVTKTQDAYLWLLDRTGIYLGTVCMIDYIASAGCLAMRDGYMSWIWIVFLGIFGITCAFRYWWQEKGMNDAINAGAMAFEASHFRTFGNIFFLTQIVLDVALFTRWDFIFDVILLLAQYLGCVKIRDRDKKPFFEKKQELALEGSR